MPNLTQNGRLYFIAIPTAFPISFILTPIVRALALRFGWVDAPSSSVKTHKVTTPSLGGVAIFAGFAGTLLLLRFMTQFPTGTLRSLRGLLVGGALVFLLGIVDDLKKPAGLHFKPKFLVQGLAAVVLMSFDLQIHFIAPDYLAKLLTFFWVVGITNAFNIIDIMDGLAASQAAAAALGFWLIALPSEDLYVNFAAAALLGSSLGFLPWNFSKKNRIFMGDSGSLFLGFMLASVSLGKYSKVNDLGVFAPLFILLVPMYDTLFVMYLRLRKGQSPFLALRTISPCGWRMGYDRPDRRHGRRGGRRPQLLRVLGHPDDLGLGAGHLFAGACRDPAPEPGAGSGDHK